MKTEQEKGELAALYRAGTLKDFGVLEDDNANTTSVTDKVFGCHFESH